MAITPTPCGWNPGTPGLVAQYEQNSDMLVSGPRDIATFSVTIASGAGVLARGTVLGKVTASGKYIKSASAAGDGSQTPVAILADTVDATSADQVAGVYLSGEFSPTGLVLGAGWTEATVREALRPYGFVISATPQPL